MAQGALVAESQLLLGSLLCFKSFFSQEVSAALRAMVTWGGGVLLGWWLASELS